MAAGPDAHADRRAARSISLVGLCGGAVCLLVGAAVYLAAESGGPLATLPTQEETGGSALRGAAPDDSAATRVGPWLLAALKHLAPAGFAVLGTMLVTLGAVFGLLGRLGVLAVGGAPQRGMQASEPRRDLPSPEWRSGDSAPARNRPSETPASLHDLPRPQGANDGAPGVTAAREVAADDLTNMRSTHGPSPGAPAADPVRSAEPSPVRTAEPASRGVAMPHPGTEPSEPGASATETSAQPLVEVPLPPEPPQPGDLIDAWDEYRRNGDGHFSTRGLQEVLDFWGFDARVGHGDRVGAGGAVLIVEETDSPNFYVLPSFNKSPRAVADWFTDASSGALTGRTQGVTRVAQGRWLKSGTGRFEVVEQGEVR